MIIFDTANIGRFYSMPKRFIEVADGIIIAFDLTNEESFKNIENWLISYDEESKDHQKILLGNKFKLNERKREIDKERAEKFSEKYNMKYYEINSRNDPNIDIELILKEIANLILSKKLELIIKEKYNKLIKQTNNFQLDKLIKYMNK